MSDGFIYWCRRGWDAVDAGRVIRSCEAAGLQLSNPGTGLVTLIANGPDSWGEQIPTTRENLMDFAGLAAADEVNFQFWLDEETDVFTRVRRIETECAVLEFGLDGLEAPEQERVIGAVVQVLRGDRENCVGFVVDRRGATEEQDWDSVVLRGALLEHGWPDILGVRSEIAAAHGQLAQVAGRAEPPLTFFGQRCGEV
ncbi:hypothetical protein TPA0910_59900 [Streptomyces hygroscopicus subsp. sporocinereus]|uniref:Uncharacterized protein n=1 Tax=Streptomyces hygroscopicus TaxID=1912 RepID=A0ABQ3U7X5_STRHY|nr:hypothetical protein [Streptomyces hygroscopicus]GHJ31557.1 hypothetical protein TPA0910_59900 [Streptomyces hygroscopicus]